MAVNKPDVKAHDEGTPSEAAQSDGKLLLEYATDEPEEQSSLLSFWLAWSCAICWMLGAAGAWCSFPSTFAVCLIIVVILGLLNLIVGIAERDPFSIGVALINMAVAFTCILAADRPGPASPEVMARIMSLLCTGIIIPLTSRLMPTMKD